MPTRRLLLALPLLVAARPLWATTPSWSHDVSEVRLGGVDPRAMSARLGVPVRALTTDLAEALNAGHLEAALLDRPAAARAATLMGPRLELLDIETGIVAVRRALPASLRADLARALSNASFTVT